MYQAGLDYQIYFSLEDFQNNKEGVVRNTGLFWFDSALAAYTGGPKASFNAFKMLNKLGNNMFLPAVKIDDEFVGVVATYSKDTVTLVIYNYIDPEIFRNYLSRNIATLSPGERKILVALVTSDKFGKIINQQLDASSLNINSKVKSLLIKAQALNNQAAKFTNSNRNIKIALKNLKGSYLLQRYLIDSSSGGGSEFAPVEERAVDCAESFQETLSLAPYSTQMIVLRKKPAPLVENKNTPAVAQDIGTAGSDAATSGAINSTNTAK